MASCSKHRYLGRDVGTLDLDGRFSYFRRGLVACSIRSSHAGVDVRDTRARAEVGSLMRRAICLLVFTFGCVENNTNLFVGPDSPVGGVGGSSAIDALRIEPNQFELANGDIVSAVVVGSVGGVEVRDFDFIASIAPDQSVATIQSQTGNVITFKAESPGSTFLRVSAGSSTAEAPIRVVAAN